MINLGLVDLLSSIPWPRLAMRSMIHRKLLVPATLFLLSAWPTMAAVPEWGQCGGLNYNGDTQCAAGLTCVYINDWYSQCQKGASSPPVTTPTSSNPGPTSSSPVPVPTGFVRASGTGFTLDGAPFVAVGTNSYWAGLSGLSSANMDQAFADMAAFGATVVRTWGFNDVTSPSGVYYQLWSGSTPTVNTGSNGLGSFDNVIRTAKAHGIRLIVALTNNWSDYGGMDVYVRQITGSTTHSLFYTDSRVITAYKNYIRTFVTRYVNEPGIFGWELANEPRCQGCNPSVVTNWARDISAYIKSIDPNHMVAIGDEGFFNQPGHPSYPYQGGEGIDFVANLQIPSVDFATCHAYPDHWGESSNAINWGRDWINDHADAMKTANKPVLMEEFGVETNQYNTYAIWYDTIVSSGLTGDLIWQAGSIFSGFSSHDDGYTIYPNDPVYPLQQDHATKLKAARGGSQ